MRLSKEALESLRGILAGQGCLPDPEAADDDDLEDLGLFLLELTASAIKTREKMRMTGRRLPPSGFPETGKDTTQMRLPGFGD